MNDKKLTKMIPFDFETEKRSLLRYETKLHANQEGSIGYSSDKENRLNMKAPAKRPTVNVSGQLLDN